VHGAGRLFGRKGANQQLSRAEWMTWIGRKGMTLIGWEADGHRRLPDVLAAHVGAVKILHTLRPIIVVMAGRSGKNICLRIEMHCRQIDQVTKIGSTPAISVGSLICQKQPWAELLPISKTKDGRSDREHGVTYNRHPKSVVADKRDLNEYGDNRKHDNGHRDQE
jgi:hypothetical protein